MDTPRAAWIVLTWLGACLACGCQWVPQSRLASCESRFRALASQNRAQLAEIENLNAHNRDVEDQLRMTEEDLAWLEEKAGLDQKRLVNYQREREDLRDRFSGSGGQIPWGVSAQLAALAKRYPSLQFDPETGISKLDIDVLFTSGKANLSPDAKELLRAYAEIFRQPEASELRIMVAGHTDSRLVAKKPTRELYPDNWYLSAGRALAVADFLRESGVPEEQMGVQAFGSQQPIASNSDKEAQRLNRRVEIFVTGPETPIVGWAETIPSVY